MITSLLLAGLLSLAPHPQEEATDPYELNPLELPAAEEGTWAELFNGREMVLRVVPPEAIPLMDGCRAAYVQRDYATALASYFDLLETYPDFPPALLELGTVYFRLRRYGDAIVSLERFLTIAPNQVWRTQVLAHSYYSLGRYDDARKHYAAVLEEIPESVEAIRGLALSHYRQGQSELALKELARVVALDNRHAEAYMWQAQILLEEERVEEALVAAKRARDLGRFHPRPWYLLWQIHLDLGNAKPAEAAHREWQRIDSLAQQVRGLEGQLLFRPNDYGLAMRLATLQEELGDSQGVRRAFQQAVRSRPKEVAELGLRLHVLDVLFEMEDTEGAAEAAEALGRYCSEEPAAWKRLETYYARVGNAAMQVRAGELFLRLSRSE